VPFCSAQEAVAPAPVAAAEFVGAAIAVAATNLGTAISTAINTAQGKIQTGKI